MTPSYTTLLSLLPDPAGRREGDWPALFEAFDWVRAMAECPQEPRWHAEGDVWTHTRMVIDELMGLPAWDDLSEGERTVLLVAALLHDVAKPETTREEAGLIRSPGHSRRGEVRARRLLWEMGSPVLLRETVAQLIRHHQVPFHLLGQPDPERTARRISWDVRTDLLWVLASADARGRRGEGREASIEATRLFREFLLEADAFGRAFPFPSATSRMEWRRQSERNPYYLAHEDEGATMVVLSGLPGMGKSSWIRDRLPGWPVEGYDRLRRELRLPYGKNEGRVIQEGKERIRRHLAAGTSFIFDSTALTRELRDRLADLALDYGARLRLVHLDVPATLQPIRNRDRSDPVPGEAIHRMLERWEAPTAGEAHEVTYVLHPQDAGRQPAELTIAPWGERDLVGASERSFAEDSSRTTG